MSLIVVIIFYCCDGQFWWFLLPSQLTAWLLKWNSHILRGHQTTNPNNSQKNKGEIPQNYHGFASTLSLNPPQKKSGDIAWPKRPRLRIPALLPRFFFNFFFFALVRPRQNSEAMASPISSATSFSKRYKIFLVLLKKMPSRPPCKFFESWFLIIFLFWCFSCCKEVSKTIVVLDAWKKTHTSHTNLSESSWTFQVFELPFWGQNDEGIRQQVPRWSIIAPHDGRWRVASKKTKRWFLRIIFVNMQHACKIKSLNKKYSHF